MRRDHFTVAVRETETGYPMLSIDYDGPREFLDRRLRADGDELYEPEEIDAAFRLLDSLDADEARGVFSLAHRLTGEYLAELNVDAEELIDLIQLARGGDEEEDGTRYRVRIDVDDDDSVDFDLDALFVYDEDGELLREKSLIPSGVEL